MYIHILNRSCRCYGMVTDAVAICQLRGFYAGFFCHYLIRPSLPYVQRTFCWGEFVAECANTCTRYTQEKTKGLSIQLSQDIYQHDTSSQWDVHFLRAKGATSPSSSGAEKKDVSFVIFQAGNYLELFSVFLFSFKKCSLNIWGGGEKRIRGRERAILRTAGC